MRNEGNLSRMEGAVALQKELDALKEENISLKNQLADQLAKTTAFNKSNDSERRQIVLYLEEISLRIHGIPAISSIIRNVLEKIASGINNGDHLKQETYSRR